MPSRSTWKDQPEPAAAVAPAPPTAAFDAMARMVAHEVRNLLTPTRAAGQLAIEDPSNTDQVLQALQKAVLACERVAAITDAILERAPSPPKTLDLRELLDEAISVCTLGAAAPTHFIIEGDAAPVRTSHTHLRHILINLITNASRAAARRGGAVRISLECSTWNTTRGVAITIDDDGAGLPGDVLHFLNHDRLKLDGRPEKSPERPAGLGVGLEVVRRLALDIGASITAANRPTGGASIRLFIPSLATELAHAA